jgi:hypothetical protein
MAGQVMASKKRKCDWIVNDATDNGAFVCRRCWTRHKLPLPCSVKLFLAAGKAFMEEHGKCKEQTK